MESSSPCDAPINMSTLSGTSSDRLIFSIVDKGGSRSFRSSKEIYEGDKPARAAKAGIDSFFCCRQNLIACPRFIFDLVLPNLGPAEN